MTIPSVCNQNFTVLMSSSLKKGPSKSPSLVYACPSMFWGGGGAYPRSRYVYPSMMLGVVVVGGRGWTYPRSRGTKNTNRVIPKNNNASLFRRRLNKDER